MACFNDTPRPSGTPLKRGIRMVVAVIEDMANKMPFGRKILKMKLDIKDMANKSPLWRGDLGVC